MRQTLACAVSLTCVLWLLPLAAQEQAPRGARYVADIELESSLELTEILQRASQLLVEGAAVQGGGARVTFVLHGPVIRDLLRQNYLASRELVDLAASLSAMQVIQIEVCRTWMSLNGVYEEDLQPFVAPVDLASSELRRLRREQGYLDF